MCLKEGMKASWKKQWAKGETEFQATWAPWVRAAGTCLNHSLLRILLWVCHSLHLPLTLHSFLFPRSLKSNCCGFDLTSVFSFIACLITIPKWKETVCDTSQLVPWEKSMWKMKEGFFKFSSVKLVPVVICKCRNNYLNCSKLYLIETKVSIHSNIIKHILWFYILF